MMMRLTLLLIGIFTLNAQAGIRCEEIQIGPTGPHFSFILEQDALPIPSGTCVRFYSKLDSENQPCRFGLRSLTVGVDETRLLKKSGLLPDGQFAIISDEHTFADVEEADIKILQVTPVYGDEYAVRFDLTAAFLRDVHGKPATAYNLMTFCSVRPN